MFNNFNGSNIESSVKLIDKIADIEIKLDKLRKKKKSLEIKLAKMIEN